MLKQRSNFSRITIRRSPRSFFKSLNRTDMSLNLLDSVKGFLTPDLVSQAASLLGEQESGITKALGAATPAILQGIIRHASTDGGSGIMDLARQAAGTGILDQVSGLFGGSSASLLSQGAQWLGTIFGSKSSGLGSLLSSFAGIKSSSSQSILSALAPLALGFIGKQVSSQGLSAQGLMSWLSGQGDSIKSAIPSGFNLASLWEDSPRATPVEVPASGGSAEGMPKWLLPLLLLVLGALALWYFMRGCEARPVAPAVVDTPAVEAVPIGDTLAAVGRETLNVTLPDGTVLSAFKGGIEDRLVSCLNDTACRVGKDVWFDFDNLNFEMGSAKITAESQAQVNNIAAILKAYPKVKIKIGGYTDKTGDAAANKKLSQERAEAVTRAIQSAGAAAAQLLAAEGYGSEFATVPAEASDEARKVDRRISVSVREK